LIAIKKISQGIGRIRINKGVIRRAITAGITRISDKEVSMEFRRIMISRI